MLADESERPADAHVTADGTPGPTRLLLRG